VIPGAETHRVSPHLQRPLAQNSLSRVAGLVVDVAGFLLQLKLILAADPFPQETAPDAERKEFAPSERVSPAEWYSSRSSARESSTSEA